MWFDVAMGRFNEEMVKAGVMLDANGLPADNEALRKEPELLAQAQKLKNA